MLIGLTMRLLAARTRGAFSTRTLVTAPEQPVVQVGLYRLVRHPGCLGDLILWTGAALATHNLVAIVGIPVLMVAVYAYRIRREEIMLKATLGEAYTAYMAHSWRLIPWVY